MDELLETLDILLTSVRAVGMFPTDPEMVRIANILEAAFKERLKELIGS